MAIRVASTKTELKEALEDKADEIIIDDEELIKKVRAVKKFKNISKKALKFVLPLIAAGVVTAPVTGGATLPATFAVRATAAGSEIYASLISALAPLIFLETVAIIALIKDYDEIEIEANTGVGNSKLRLKKRPPTGHA